MAKLMNINETTMPLGPGTGATGGQADGPRRHFKHIGELKDGGAKVVIVYRTVPNEPNNCLVVGTKFLPDIYHDSLMKAVESDGGQVEKEFGVFMSRQTFPDGTNMLQLLHNDNYIKKFSTKDIIVTFGATADGRLSLDKLNTQIAKDLGVKVSELAVPDDTPVAETTAKTSDAKKTKK